MLIRATGTIKRNEEVISPGEEVSIPDAEAFNIVKQGFAEPASRRARRVYDAMKNAHDAKLPKSVFATLNPRVFEPKVETYPPVRNGKVNRIN